MADVDQKLFQELKFHYPEVPDSIVTNLLSQLGNDRNRCMEMLANASPNYLFDQTSNSYRDSLAHFSRINISERRPLNGLSESNMSSASATPPRPPYNTSHSLINIPGYRGPIITADDHPSTAPVIPNEINRFLDMYGDQQTQNIPNIDCSNSVIMGYSRANVNVKDYVSNSGNQGACSSQTVLRPIEVHHIQTSKETQETNVNLSTRPSVLYQICIDPSQGSHVTPSNQQQTSNSRCQLRYPVGVNSYQNVISPTSQTTSFSSDPRSQHNMLNLGMASAYKSPIDEHRNLNQYGPQHSSQATIYLKNPATTSGNNPQFNAMPLEDWNLNSPLPGQYNHSVHNSVNDPVGFSQNILRAPGSQSSPQAGGQIVVEIKTPRRDGGVQSHIQYFNKIANSSPVGTGQVNAQHSMLLGNLSPLNENPVFESQNSVTRPSYFSEHPNMINIQGHNTSCNESGFLKYSQQLPECHIQGHYPHGICHESGSFESVAGYVPDMDYRHMLSQPVDSPTCSQSSISSDSSAATRQRPRSGSLQDDSAYLQALISHQKLGMEKLCIVLGLAEKRLHELKREVIGMESHAIERKRNESSRFPSSVDLARLRGDNLQLQADIQLMTKEIDLFNNGQTPLGVLDPLEQQNFYKSVNTGQSGSIYASTSMTGTPKLYSSSVTASLTTSAATTPTRLLPEIPPQLPPREPRREVPPPRPPRTVVPISNVPPHPPTQLPVTGDFDTDGEQWSCSACTLLNHPALNKCECCEMPRMNVVMSPVSPRGSMSHAHVHSDLCYCHDH